MKNRLGKDDKRGGPKGAKPPKKGGGMAMLLIVPALTAVAALAFIPAARAKAISALADIKTAAASAIRNRPQQADDAAAGMPGSDATLKIQNNIVSKLTELELRESDYSIRYFPKDSTIEIGASIPRGKPMEWIILELASAAKSTPYGVDDCFCASEASCTMTLKSSNSRHPKIVIKAGRSGRYFSNTAKMAILIEDLGFEATTAAAEYLAFPEPLTVSFVPVDHARLSPQRMSAWAAQAAESKKEIVLSLPMEPLPGDTAKYNRYRQSTIKIHLSEDEIRGIISHAAAAVPNFAGMANFHGARAMEDSRVMGIVLSEANKRKVYFVYTDASRKSVTPQLVKSMKVPSHPVQGAIDASHSAEQARERLRRFAMTAERTGKVLVRAQPSQAFIQVLKEETEPLKRNGIRLVYVSELMK
jgi:polysaccharide deacetylase 2 family uncharacterized protein YibQ